MKIELMYTNESLLKSLDSHLILDDVEFSKTPLISPQDIIDKLHNIDAPVMILDGNLVGKDMEVIFKIKESLPDMFIIVVSDEKPTDSKYQQKLIKTGVHDHIVGMDLNRLSFAVNSAVRARRLEARIRESESRFKRLAQAPFLGIVIHDSGVLVDANDAVAQMMGLSLIEDKQDLLSTNIIDFVAPEYQQLVGQKIFSENEEIYEIYCVKKDGTRFPVEIVGKAFPQDGKIFRITTLRDISDRKNKEELLKDSYENLRKTLRSTVDAMGSTVETRDPYTAGHQRQVTKVALLIGQQLGLADQNLEALKLATLVHDIGKLAVPSEILSKPGKLSDLEFSMIKVHASVSEQILSNIEFQMPIAKIAGQHHEKLDGTGYPNNLTDKDILYEAKILAVADVFDAISSHRPYRPSLGMDFAINELQEMSGRHFDKDAVEALVEVVSAGKIDLYPHK